MPIYSIEKAYIAYAIGTDITTNFRNGDIVLALDEIQAIDKFDAQQNLAIDFTDPETEEGGYMSSSQYKARRSTGKKIGKVILPMFLQTSWPLYAILGSCTTTRTGAEITTVKCTAKNLSPDLSTFHFWVLDAAGAITEYYIWLDEAGGAAPEEEGTAIRANISTAVTAAQVAGVIAPLINDKGNVTSGNVEALITITNTQHGAVTDCSSSEGLSTGYTITVTTQGASTHAITLNSSQEPIYLGFHFEKEMTDDSESVRYDFLGYMPDFWRLYCGDDKSRWKARQELSCNFAYARASGGDLAEPTKLPARIYEWNDLKGTNGEISIKYAGTDLEFTIKSFDLTITRTKPLWGVKGASKMPKAAFISGVAIELLLEGYLTGNNVRTLMAIEPEDYAGAKVDAIIKFYKGTNREYGITLNNLYLVPDQTVLNEIDWYERKTLRFVVYDSTTTIVGSVEGPQDKTYCEND